MFFVFGAGQAWRSWLVPVDGPGRNFCHTISSRSGVDHPSILGDKAEDFECTFG